MSDEQKIVIATEHGFTYRDIENELCFESSIISRVLKYYREHQENPKKEKRGTPSKLTSNVLFNINQMINANAKTTLNKMSKAMSNESFKISKTTVAKGCHMMRYQYKQQQRTINLTEEQKINRVNFARTLIIKNYKNQIDLTNIICSDESRFVLGDDKQWVWRRYGERNPNGMRKTSKFPLSLMIYGTVWLEYKSKLVFSEGSINSLIYRKNIKEYGRDMWIFGITIFDSVAIPHEKQ